MQSRTGSIGQPDVAFAWLGAPAHGESRGREQRREAASAAGAAAACVSPESAARRPQCCGPAPQGAGCRCRVVLRSAADMPRHGLGQCFVGHHHRAQHLVGTQQGRFFLPPHPYSAHGQFQPSAACRVSGMAAEARMAALAIWAWIQRFRLCCVARRQCPRGAFARSRFCSYDARECWLQPVPWQCPGPPGRSPPTPALPDVALGGGRSQRGRRAFPARGPVERLSSQACSGAMAANSKGSSAIEIRGPPAGAQCPANSGQGYAQAGQDERKLANLRQTGRHSQRRVQRIPERQHQPKAANGLAQHDDGPSTPSTCSGCSTSTLGWNSMPTDTKNSTENHPF